MRRKSRLSVDTYVSGILAQDRVILSQAITVIESGLATDQALANQILEKTLSHTGKSIRIGITGVPGVGKSTFIEALGKHITQQGKKLAVLAVDPSSQRSKGSIMGDKTRMEQLTLDPLAYIRPSPTGSSLGGVAKRTRETLLLCEAAGFEVILIETVGVGQSETLVKGMVDFFLLLMLAGAGDELQGIKKGIMEMADAIAINKADGENIGNAQKAQSEYKSALHLFPVAQSAWIPQVLTCSAVTQQGIPEIWNLILQYQQQMKASTFFEENRKQQNLDWMHQTIQQYLMDSFYQHDQVKENLPRMENLVKEGKLPTMQAVLELLEIYKLNF